MNHYRNSKQRTRIYEILAATDSHPTADWVYEKLKDEIPHLSLGTVYRNIKILLEQGLIQKLPSGSAHDRFDGRMQPHYHLLCEQCGGVSDLEIPFFNEINALVEEKSRFKISRHRLEFFGICESCQHT